MYKRIRLQATERNRAEGTGRVWRKCQGSVWKDGCDLGREQASWIKGRTHEQRSAEINCELPKNTHFQVAETPMSSIKVREENSADLW